MAEPREINVYTHDYKTTRIPGDFRPHAVPYDTPDPVVTPPPDVAKEIQEALDEEAAARDFKLAPETETEPGPSEKTSDATSSPSSSSETKSGWSEPPVADTTSVPSPPPAAPVPPKPPTAGPTPTIPSSPLTHNPSAKESSSVPPVL